MRKIAVALLAIALSIGAISTTRADISIIPAGKDWLENGNLENALRNIPDISAFNQALVDTGVINELRSGTHTVFAPANAAFTTFRDKELCPPPAPCKTPMAEFLRALIASGKMHLSGADEQGGGVFSVNGHFLRIGALGRDSYVVNGQTIRGGHAFSGGMLYVVEGVPVTALELEKPKPRSIVPPRAPKARETVTTVIDKNCDREPGCRSETTIIERMVEEPAGTP